ncbi:hypothetical protein [Streptomyces sp. CFMR 7]|uniref:hypothetical protein n=1 Tax=Streptomyces sp. CFMR 7 TaxID=1649184 RepID=UPI00164297F4|nr:hypothetical protein [Streptomyces sp. CFMR 7]
MLCVLTVQRVLRPTLLLTPCTAHGPALAPAHDGRADQHEETTEQSQPHTAAEPVAVARHRQAALGLRLPDHPENGESERDDPGDQNKEPGPERDAENGEEGSDQEREKQGCEEARAGIRDAGPGEQLPYSEVVSEPTGVPVAEGSPERCGRTEHGQNKSHSVADTPYHAVTSRQVGSVHAALTCRIPP